MTVWKDMIPCGSEQQDDKPEAKCFKPSDIRWRFSNELKHDCYGELEDCCVRLKNFKQSNNSA